MNLITCAEDCEYQQDGYCRLEAGAPVSSVRVGGCSYYQRRKGASARREPEAEAGKKA